MNDFRQRLLAGDLLAGTWVKTPHPHVVEVLGLSGLDATALDAEHAPFDRGDLDACLLAAKATGMPALVRIAHLAPEAILQALDCGADGIIAPHIRSAAEAEALVRMAHYGPGGRGFAGSTRAAGYTSKGMAKSRADAAEIAVIAQIEDAEALPGIDAICAVEGVDTIFIGRIDLTISLDCESPDDPKVVDAVEAICAAASEAGRRVGMFVSRVEDVSQWRAKGVSLFLLQSDQDFILRGAKSLGEAIRS